MIIGEDKSEYQPVRSEKGWHHCSLITKPWRDLKVRPAGDHTGACLSTKLDNTVMTVIVMW